MIELRCDPLAALRRHWGYDSFRTHQAEAIDAAIAGQDVLVVLPTGGGKSLCYQVPAACGLGLVVVVSPLIALMDDQVASAREAGLSAGALHSNLSGSARREVQAALAAGTLDLLYVSPERLLAERFDLHDRLALWAVDEAHCVSFWGHDFRPEYRQLAEVFALTPHVPRLALTATATPQVQQDIVTVLSLRQPCRLVGHVDRPNLIFQVQPRGDRLQQILTVIARHPGDGGIIYALTRRETEEIARLLTAHGVDAVAYHAGLNAQVRASIQADFVAERRAVVVATIAFGMGIDRSNVRFVIHAGMPRSIEHYQQESGRAGRDGLPADCVLLWSGADLVMHRQLALKDEPPPERRRAIEKQLAQIGRFATAPVCRHRLIAEHFGQTWPPPGKESPDGLCGACDLCLGETQELPPTEARTIALKIISAVWRLDGHFGASHVTDVLLGRTGEKVLRNGHDRLSVHGLLREAGEHSIRTWIDQLVVQGFLTVTEGEYPLLVMTPAGRSLCKGVGTVRLAKPSASAKRRKKATSPAGPEVSPTPTGQRHFENLRALRRLVAERFGIPPYIVFPDSTLTNLAQAVPTDEAGLLTVKGIGERKAAAYGAAVLAVLAGRSPEEAAKLVHAH